MKSRSAYARTNKVLPRNTQEIFLLSEPVFKYMVKFSKMCATKYVSLLKCINIFPIYTTYMIKIIPSFENLNKIARKTVPMTTASNLKFCHNNFKHSQMPNLSLIHFRLKHPYKILLHFNLLGDFIMFTGI